MDYNKAREKAEKLVSKMTAEEKMSQLLYDSPAIERLNINEYNWWNEALHGVARAGIATVFPQAIGLAATFDPELIREVGDIVSTEGRAKYNYNSKNGDRGIYKGLTYWSPNINIFRDPRWGRGQETFGEDPFLTAVMGCAYVKGLQGGGEYLKSAACVKHFAAHSGPEGLRHSFNCEVCKKDLYETYFPAFEYAVKSGVAGVMGAYNRINGEPACAHSDIKSVIREKWGFRGYFVSDCFAIKDISENHHFTETQTEAAALALKAGCNLNCGEAYKYLVDAYEEDLIDDADITEAAVKLFTIRALLGEFEDEKPFSDIGYDKLSCASHELFNLDTARQSLVLLKNENGFLPLDKKAFKKIAVIGPTAMSITALEGNYNGHAAEYVTVADGIRKTFYYSDITVAEGSQLCFDKSKYFDGFVDLENEAAAVAENADVTVLCLGLDRSIEGEDTWRETDYSNRGDRKTLGLPKTQQKLIEKVCKTAKNIIVVTLCGSGVDLGEELREKAKAIIHAWYPGAMGGLAIAQLLAGEFSPSGKLPITFYSEKNVLPDITDYSMQGRTYRYINEKPLYPFGYGLGFCDFEFNCLKLEDINENEIRLSLRASNNGKMRASEKLQIYAEFTDSRTQTPNYQLCAVKTIEIDAQRTKEIEITVSRHWIKAVLPDGTRVEPDGKITLYAGSHQPDERSNELCSRPCLSVELNLNK